MICLEEFKMDIRKWFGSTVQYDSESGFNRCLDQLLVLYRKAIVEYFELYLPLDVQELIIYAYKTDSLHKGKKRFLDWFENEGLSKLQFLAEKTGTRNESEVIAEIEYIIFLLNEEMDFEFPDDVRACLINIVTELPSLINQIAEKQCELVVHDYHIIDWYSLYPQEKISHSPEHMSWYWIKDDIKCNSDLTSEYYTQCVSVEVKSATKQASIFFQEKLDLFC